MKVLSLFDGISCARVALERAGIPVEAYYASEIDKYAIQVSQKNYPEIQHVGSVVGLGLLNYPLGGIDLLIGGSPCQDLSIANKNRKGLAGEKSGLFYEYLRILREVKPKYFILENVASMSQESRDTISKELGVEPIMINATLVSAQQRKRYFWTNIPNVTLPEDRNIFLKDILCDEEKWDTNTVYQYRRYYMRITEGGKVPTLTANMGTGGHNVPFVRVLEATKKGYVDIKVGECVDLTQPNSKTRRGRSMVEKSNCLTTSDMQYYKLTKQGLRKLLPVECERLQGLPDNYSGGGASDSQRYKMLGNAFNVDVIAHILSFIKKQL